MRRRGAGRHRISGCSGAWRAAAARLLAGLLIWTALPIVVDQGGPPTAVASGSTCVSSLDPAHLNQMFRSAVSGFVGLDSLRVFPLPDGRSLWLFQDAYSILDGASSTDLGEAGFAHNGALVEDHGCFTALGGAAGPQDACTRAGDASFVGGQYTLNCSRWLWPMGGGIGADGQLHVFYAQVGNPVGIGATDGAAPEAVWRATIDVHTLQVTGLVPATDSGGDVLYGWSVESDPEYSYLFGYSYDQFDLPDPTSPPPSATFLARVPRGRFEQAPAYWDGSGWTSSRGAARPVNQAQGLRPYAMQPRLIDGVWVSVSKIGDWFGSDLAVDSAPAAQGPWARVRTMSLPTKTQSGSTNNYSPHLLPWRTSLGNLIVAVSNNAWAMNPEAYADPWLYRPSFMEIEPPASMSRVALEATSPTMGFVASTPVRALDTRTTKVPVAAGQIRRIPLAAQTGANALAVAVNLVAVSPASDGFLTLWSCDAPRPWASNANVTARRTQSSFAIVALPTSREVCLFSSTTTHVVIDVFGTYVDRADPSATSYTSAGPTRLFDSRVSGGRLVTGAVRRIQVGVGASAASVNLAVTGPDTAGYVTAWPCDQARPSTASINVEAGQTLSNFAQVALSASGELCVMSSMRTDVVVDLLGTFSADPDGWWFQTTAPIRLVDTREGVGAPLGPITRFRFGLPSTSANAIPALTAVPDDVHAVVMTAVVVDPETPGWMAVAPCVDDAAYATVALNADAGQDVANVTVVPTRATSGKDICSFTMAIAHQVLDLTGWYVS